MHVELFTALTSAKVDEQRATTVVAALEKHMATLVQQAVSPLSDKIDNVDRRITESVGNLDKRISTLTTITGVVAILVPVALLFGPLIAKLAS